tara:strand:- start:982 stop:1797 length:816 start_codon:yes stop_codon:yes gene_type:complete
MNFELIQQNSKTIFISLIAFSVVVLIVISYFVFIGNNDNDNDNDNNNNNDNNNDNVNKTKNNLEEAQKPENSSNEQINNNSNDYSAYNNENSLMKGIDSNPLSSTALLENVRDNSYKDYQGNQVYNISNNIFSYEDARAACKAHGAELATYDQVMDAYKNGAEWCNYGWSENQQALYPTQKSTWKNLQKNPEQANDCGNYGVNGGYFENPNTLFGANCYGVKPEPKDRERIVPVPASGYERNILAKVEKYKQEKDSLTIKPYNKVRWSRSD